MGNVQQSYSSPFVFQSSNVPAEPFAAEKRSIIRRRIQGVAQKSRIKNRGIDDESSTTSSIQSSAQNSISPPRLPPYRTILQQLIELQDWQRVLCRMELYPEEVHQYMPILVDGSKIERTIPSTNRSATIFVTPLHLVCSLNPPLHVVTTILRLGGPETASMTIRPNATRKKTMQQKHLFWQHRRNRMITSAERNRRQPRNQKSDDQSQVSDSTPSISSRWQTLQSSSSDSSAWNEKINFRFSFDDYKRRIKYAIKQRRSRGGAFPIVELLNEDSDDEDDSESQYYSIDGFDSQQQLDAKPPSLETEKLATAITTDCSESHQSSISATPPRSSVSDQSVILQLSSSGGLRPMPIRKVHRGTPAVASSKVFDEPQGFGTEVSPKCMPLHDIGHKNHSPLFRVQWDLIPLLRHVLEEGSLLPLHVAVLYSASSEITRALVDAYPPAALCDVSGMLPIHFVAAGWRLPPLLPTPETVENFKTSNDLEISEPIHHSGILQSLTALQQAAPDSVLIRSGNNRMKPAEYINECMEDSSCKNACLRVCNGDLSNGRGNNESRLSDVDTSFASSSDDIFDFSDTIPSSTDDCIESTLDIRLVTSTGNEEHFEYLSSLMAARDWHSVSVAIELYPSLATQWIFGIDDVSASICKRLPLHCACLYSGPIDLIEMLIKLHPEGIKTLDPTDLSTPLSLACFANCSSDIIRLVLRAYPRAIDVVNVYGQVPLQVAILSKASFIVIEMLVEEQPHLVVLKDNDGRNAIDYAKIVYGDKHTVHQFLLEIMDVLLTDKIHW